MTAFPTHLNAHFRVEASKPLSKGKTMSIKTLLIPAALSVALAGCATAERQYDNASSAERGAVIGAAGGAAAGAIIAGSGDDLEGALIGSGIGAAAGYLLGNERDKDRQYQGQNQGQYQGQGQRYLDQGTGRYYYIDPATGATYYENGERRS
jgi:hypothetical protein